MPATKLKWCDGAPLVKVPGIRKLVRVSRLIAGGDSNPKTRKNSKRGYLTCALSLAPHKSAGIGNLCGSASPGCVDACLDHQGHAAVFRSIRAARIAKTIVWHQERQWFLDNLVADLERWQRKAERDGKALCARLNMFSDIHWERIGIPQLFPQIEFYDYTKHMRAGAVLGNYWVTYSRSETNQSEALEVLRNAGNVAVVFHDTLNGFVGNQSKRQKLPKTWNGFKVVDGDESDLRFEDPRGRKHGRVIGLRLKAHSHEERIQAYQSGFAVDWRNE